MNAVAELLPLQAAAAELHVKPQLLRRMARRGQFPELLRVTQKHCLVRRADFEAWKAGRWTRAEETRAALVAEVVRGERHPRNRRAKGA